MNETNYEHFLSEIFKVMDDFGVSSEALIDVFSDIYHRMKDIEGMRNE